MNFTEQQKAVIESTSDAIVCVAVPGSGKTTVLIARIHELIRQYQQPEKIVAITYTVAAAEEIQRRLGSVRIGYVGTLHSWCFKRLQRLASDIGFTAPLSIVTGQDADDLFEDHATGMNWTGTRKELNTAISEAVYSKVKNMQMSKSERIAHSFFVKMLTTGVLTFDGVLYWTIRSFDLGYAADTGIHLLVDEYQDASAADERIYSSISCETRFVVGDDAQAIYGFRGGNPNHLTSKLSNPRWLHFVIDRSQRCSERVCDSATQLMKVARLPKLVLSFTGLDGVVDVNNFESPQDEASWLANELISKRLKGYRCAVLCRTNYLVRIMSVQLASRGVPMAGGGEKKYAFDPRDWAKVKLFLSGLANPQNNWIVAKCVAATSGKHHSEFVRAAMVSETTVNGLMRVFPEYATVEEGINWLASMPGRVGESTLLAIRSIFDRVRPGSFFELLGVMQQLEDEVEDMAEGVEVKTMHGSKGLEWDFVYLPAFEQEVIPGAKSRDVEEERRLAFVALTRAKIGCHLSYCKHRTLNEFQTQPGPVTPSQFIDSLI